MKGKIFILVPLLLLLLPLVCGQDLYLRANNFTHHSHMMTWRQAQAHCRRHHTDLVTIRDEMENRVFFHGWIGLYRDDSHSLWKWSRGDEIANFTSWKKDDPDRGENCAFSYRSERAWHSDKCDYEHSFMCYTERLLLVKERKTWEGALQHCRALEAVDPSKPATDYQNHRYDLATLLNEDDHIFAREKAQEAETGVWLGLRYLAGQWVWMGGEAMQYQSTTKCPTVRLCGILVKNTTSIETRNCKKKMSFLCYKKP